ncbi:MAG: hypothetical protein LT102_15790 [Burkholderiaceae bacterium]|nr:hypothetical protein [Burkholderiaceae bacterium]
MNRPADAAPRAGLPPAWRVPLLMLGFVGLLFGTGAGLVRLGWPMPDAVAGVAALHGPLMVGGFFGVVIALERAVAIGRYWAYTGPLLAGAGALLTATGAVPAMPWAALLFLGGGLVFLAASLDVLRRQRALFTVTLALGAACWPVGTALWLAGQPIVAAVPWWLAFLVLTIAGERLELSRFLPPSRGAKAAFGVILAATVAGLAASGSPWGVLLYAAALLALSGWLLRQDIARRTVRGRALTRFIAVCLLAGYAWLAIGSLVALFAGGFVPGMRSYDAALHALTLGFVFSMVFGHAAIILPAVLRVTLPYRPSFYVPLVLLHASVAIRLIGDAGAGYGWTKVGGLLNAVALAVFIATMLGAVVRGRRSRAQASTGTARA